MTSFLMLLRQLLRDGDMGGMEELCLLADCVTGDAVKVFQCCGVQAHLKVTQAGGVG